MTFQELHDEFAEWYEKCIENGFEPEKVVNEYGYRLLTDNEEIEYVEAKFGQLWF